MTDPRITALRKDAGDRLGNRLACPRCMSADFLGEYVTGWRELREMPRMVDGRVLFRADHTTYDAEHQAFFCSNRGCNVDEEIMERRLVQIDSDGQPVVKQPAEQEALDVG